MPFHLIIRFIYDIQRQKYTQIYYKFLIRKSSLIYLILKCCFSSYTLVWFKASIVSEVYTIGAITKGTISTLKLQNKKIVCLCKNQFL